MTLAARPRSGRTVATLLAGPLLSLVLGGCASLGLAERDSSPPGVDQEAYRSMLRLNRLQGAPQDMENVRTPEPTLDQKLREGDASRDSGQLGRALWSYLQAHKMDRSDPAPVARIAALHLRDDPQRARDLFADLAQRHPESTTAHTGLGLAELAKGDLERARASLMRAVEIDNAAIALAALGVTLDRMGQHPEAQGYYRRALELRPHNYEVNNNLGVSYLMTESFEEAVEVFRRAASLQPGDPAVHNNLGIALGRLGRYDEALEAFRRGGDEKAALNNLGYVYFLNRDYRKAIVQYESALMLGGKDRIVILRNLRTAREAAAREGDAERP